MAAEIKKSHSANVTLIKGDSGIFDVKKDGQLIYSKNDTGRFPNEGEISGLLG